MDTQKNQAEREREQKGERVLFVFGEGVLLDVEMGVPSSDSNAWGKCCSLTSEIPWVESLE